MKDCDSSGGSGGGGGRACQQRSERNQRGGAERGEELLNEEPLNKDGGDLKVLRGKKQPHPGIVSQ